MKKIHLPSARRPSARLFSAFRGLTIRFALVSVLFCPIDVLYGWTQSPGPADTFIYPGVEWERIADPSSVGFSAEGLDRVRAYADSLDTTGLFVVAGGRVLLEYGDVSQVTYVASVRKSVLAMLFGRYVANGTIDLDESIGELGMDDVGGLLPMEKTATVRDLIAARSGVYHPGSNSGDSRAIAPERGSQEPGTYWLYNNWDFNAAGAAFELVTGRDIFDALQTDLAEPLQFQDFDRAVHKKGGDLSISRYPSYHMFLSTRDMARIGYLMLRDGAWNGRQIIPREWVREITSTVTPPDDLHPPGGGWGVFGYGYMWWTLVDDALPPEYRGHMYTAQGAFGQFITVIPSVDMVVAHKTAVVLDRDGTGETVERSVTWGEFSGILERLRKAMMERTSQLQP